MSRIITLAGKRWLAGMSWRSYDKPPIRSAIRVEARALNAKAFVQRTGTIRAPMGVEARYDAGFATIGQEIERGGPVFSLGAALSSSKPGSWVGVFRLNENLFYYIAVDSDGAIIPDQYGEIVGSAAEIELARAAHGSLAEAAQIEGDLAALEILIAGLAGPFLRVRPVARNLRLQPFHLVPLVAVVAALVGLEQLYVWHNAKVEYQKQVARLAAMAQAKKVVPPQSPLEKELPPDIWLGRCNPERWHLAANYNGWDLKQYECVDGSVVLTWVRGPGATAIARPAGTLADSGNLVTRIIQLGESGASDRGHTPSQSKTIPFAEARADLQGWAERVGLEVQFGTVSTVPGFTLKQSAITLNSPLGPWSLTSLSTIAGLRLQSLNSTTSGDWIVKGVLYGE